MTGRELIALIKKYDMEDKSIDEGGEEGYLTFSLSTIRNPADEDDVSYVDFRIDLITGNGSLHSF